MSKKFKNYDSFVAKMGVGFDSVLDTIEAVDKFTYDDLSRIPPYNIKKTTEKDYCVELAIPGVKKEDIKASYDADFLSVSAVIPTPVDPEGDDTYFHKGIFRGGKFDAKFTLAKNLQFKSAELVDGVLYVWFYDSNIKRVDSIIAIGPFPKTEDNTKYEVKYNSAGEPIMIPLGENVETSANAIPLTPSVEEVKVEDTATTTTVVNETTTNVPTTEVVLPDPLPQIVEVAIEPTGTSVTSAEPQATITVTEATYEVKDDTTLEVIKTPEGQPDIVISVPAEVAAVAEANGIDIVADVTAAIVKLEPEIVVAPEVPVNTISTEPVVVTDAVTEEPKVEISVPDTLPAVVELVKTEESTAEVPAVTLQPVDVTELPTDAILVPVVTQEGQNDIIVAVDPVLHAELVKADVDIAADVSTAVIEAAPEVVSVPETTTEVLNANDQTTPTVEVTLPVELPQIVEVTVESVPTVVDPVSAEPQVTLVVTDASAEIKSDNVVTEVIKTEEGKADIIVAVDAEVHADLLEQGVNVVEEVKAAIEQSEVVVAPELPPSTEEVKTTDVVVAPSEVSAEPVTVTVPDVIPQVLEATVVEDKVVLTDVSESVPAESTATPVVTQEGQPDVIIVTTPETDVKLEELGIDVAVDLSKAIIANEPEVVTPTETPADVIEAAAVETTTVTTNEDNVKAATVSVTLPTELPQIVEVSLEDVVKKVDVKSEEPQVNVVLTDATHEVSDNVTLTTVSTPEGSADLIVAVPAEVQAVLDEKKIDIMPAIEAAVKSEEVTAPVLTEAPVEPVFEAVPVVEAEALKPETAVSLEVPETVTPVMEASVATTDDLGTIVTLKPADESIPTDAVLVPVVTPGTQDDIIVAVSEEVKATLESGGEKVADILTEAVKTADVTVTDNPANIIDTTEQSVL